MGRLVVARVALVGGVPARVWFLFLRETELFWTNRPDYHIRWLEKLKSRHVDRHDVIRYLLYQQNVITLRD